MIFPESSMAIVDGPHLYIDHFPIQKPSGWCFGTCFYLAIQLGIFIPIDELVFIIPIDHL